MDPDDLPKTGDESDARPWFIALAACAYMLRHLLFVRKEGRDEC
jgi:hypothetical protein